MLFGITNRLFKKRKATIRESSIGWQLIKLMSILLLIMVFHSWAMLHFEAMSIGDAIWLTITSATTVGYGDLSAQSLMGRLSTIILIYIGGIAILAQVAAMYFEHRQDVKNRMLRGDWSWNMEDHIVFLNCPEDVGEEYFFQAISGLRQSSTEIAKLPIIIVSDQFVNGISNRLRKLDVLHVSKPLNNTDTLNSASVTEAHTIVIFAKDQLDPVSDSINFDLIDRLREVNSSARIIVEVVRDENRKRFKKAGADNIMRPMRTYPEMMMRAIIAPGSEQVIETLFDSYGEECIRYEIEIKTDWLNIIHKLTTEDYGTPIAYENLQGEVINIPSSKDVVETKAIYVIVKVEQAAEIDVIKHCLASD